MKNSNIILNGFLLKKKRHKRSLLAINYQRRWFELTADTLAYAKDPKDLRDNAGDIEFFAVHELIWIKKIDKNKLEMRFPERVLRVKAEIASDADKWLAAIEKAHKAKEQAPSTPPHRNLETFKQAHIRTFIIESDSDEEETTSPSKIQTTGSSMQFFRPPTPPKPSPPGSDDIDVAERPPSPRSLLANPRMGSMMISTPTRSEPSDDEYDSKQLPAHRWQHDTDSEKEGSSLRQEPERLVLEQPVPAASFKTSAMPRNRSADHMQHEQLVLDKPPSPCPYNNEISFSASHAGAAAAAAAAVVAVAAAAAAASPPRGKPPAPRPPKGEILTLDLPPATAQRSSNTRRSGGTDVDEVQSAHTSRPGSHQGQGQRAPSSQGAGSQRSSTCNSSRPGSQGSQLSRPDSQGRAFSGTEGDENWLDDDWDSSDDDEGRQEGSQTSSKAVAALQQAPPLRLPSPPLAPPKPAQIKKAAVATAKGAVAAREGHAPSENDAVGSAMEAHGQAGAKRPTVTGAASHGRISRQHQLEDDGYDADSDGGQQQQQQHRHLSPAKHGLPSPHSSPNGNVNDQRSPSMPQRKAPLPPQQQHDEWEKAIPAYPKDADINWVEEDWDSDAD